MAQSDYSGHYDAAKNPNSTILRVLANAGYDVSEHEPALVGEGDTYAVTVELERVTTRLVDETAKSGLSFGGVAPIDSETVRATFWVN